jgi:hypothetical protein
MLVAGSGAEGLQEDDLAECHAGIDAYTLGDTDLQRPADGVAGVPEGCGDVDPDAEGAGGAVAVEELGVALRAGALVGDAEIEDAGVED